MEKKEKTMKFLNLTIKTAVVHTITYFTMGLLAVTFLNYREMYASPELHLLMRQVSDPIVAAGPMFQPIRGLLFAIAFYPFYDTIFNRKNGWLAMWSVLVMIGILSTFGPTPGSMEGLIYTIIPIPYQLIGLLEVIPQAFLLSVILHYWVNHPEKKWISWVLGIIMALFYLFSTLGVLAAAGILKVP
jgi:hypothetical protein